MGPFEQLVMLATLHLEGRACRSTITEMVRRRAGRTVLAGSVSKALDRLEEKGYVRTAPRSPSYYVDGRAWCFYRLTSDGHASLQRVLRAVDRMRMGLRGYESPGCPRGPGGAA